MSLATKIRRLIENADMVAEKSNTPEMSDFESMSDEELEALASDKDLSDMIVKGEDGAIANREVIVKALETISMNDQPEAEVEEAVVCETDDEYASMSDSEIQQAAYQCGCEDSIVQDGEGGLANRDEMIAMLKDAEGVNESVIVEAGDEEEENAEDELPVAGDEVEGTADLESDLSAEDGAEDGAGEPGDLEAAANADTAEGDEESPDEEPDVTVVVVSPELQDEEEKDKEEGQEEQEEACKVKMEHIDALTSDTSLSEEYKAKAKTVFEAALNEQVLTVKKSLTEKFDAKAKSLKEGYDKQVLALTAKHAKNLTEAKEKAVTDLSNVVDGYMTHAVESWIEENAVQLERNVRAEITEQFIDGLKNLFTESYIEVPEQKFDLVKAQEAKIKQLEEQAVKLQAGRSKALKEAAALKCEKVIAEATAGLTDMQRARFEQLVESVEFDTIPQFESKVKVLRESYFKTDATATPIRKVRKPLVEQVVEIEEKSQPQESAIDKYVKIIAQTTRK